MYIFEIYLMVEGSIVVLVGNGFQEFGELGVFGDIVGEGWGCYFGWMCGG